MSAPTIYIYTLSHTFEEVKNLNGGIQTSDIIVTM